MRVFRQRLETGLLQGAALAALSLAACSGSEVGGGTASGGGGESAGTAAMTGRTGGGYVAGSPGIPVDTLQPYPVDQLACDGPDYEPDAGQLGLHGQCCTSSECVAPVNGFCAPVENPTPGSGSGYCYCGEPTRGPYASNPTQPADPPGTCCYLVSSIRCD